MIDVLIVEDDPMVADLNRKYLQMISGFRLAGIVNNGEVALEFIAKQPVSLILLDLFMPKLDGLELLKNIRVNYPNTDIIMVTAARNTEAIQTALRLGVIDYIVKPFTFERLRTALLTYRERVRLLSSSSDIDQSELDQQILNKLSPPSKVLPKGIDAETLAGVKQIITDYGQSFMIGDLVPLTHLSRISLKKYIDYLDEHGDLESHLVYSAVGRPARMYTITKDEY